MLNLNGLVVLFINSEISIIGPCISLPRCNPAYLIADVTNITKSVSDFYNLMFCLNCTLSMIFCNSGILFLFTNLILIYSNKNFYFVWSEIVMFSRLGGH